MDKQQSPQHTELGQSVIAGLNCPHPFLPKQAHSYVSSFDHWDIIGPVSDGKGDLIEFLSHNPHHFCLLDGKQSTTYYCLARFGQLCQQLFIITIVENVGEVTTLDE